MLAKRPILFIISLFILIPVVQSGCSNTYPIEKKLAKWEKKIFWWEGTPSFRTDLKMKVAVAPFEDRARLGDPSVSLAIAQKLADRLAKDENIVVVPWKDVAAMMDAQGIPSPLTTSTVPLVGRAMGLNAIILGTIGEVSQTTQQTGVLSFIPLDIPYLSETNEVITAVLVARAVDVESGILMGADIGSGETFAELAEDEIFVQPAGKQVTQEVWSKSMDKAADALGEEIIDALSVAHWKGVIVDVSNDRATLAAGQDVGVEAGDKFIVYSVAEKITNVAGQTYAVPGPVKSSLEAVSVGFDTTQLQIITGQVTPGEVAQAVE